MTSTAHMTEAAEAQPSTDTDDAGYSWRPRPPCFWWPDRPGWLERILANWTLWLCLVPVDALLLAQGDGTPACTAGLFLAMAIAFVAYDAMLTLYNLHSIETLIAHLAAVDHDDLDLRRQTCRPMALLGVTGGERRWPAFLEPLTFSVLCRTDTGRWFLLEVPLLLGRPMPGHRLQPVGEAEALQKFTAGYVHRQRCPGMPRTGADRPPAGASAAGNAAAPSGAAPF